MVLRSERILSQNNPNLTNNHQKNKIKISADIIHNRFHRSNSAIATIRAHDLWDDVQIADGTDTLCTSCKIMTIPAHARIKHRNSIVTQP